MRKITTQQNIHFITVYMWIEHHHHYHYHYIIIIRLFFVKKKWFAERLNRTKWLHVYNVCPQMMAPPNHRMKENETLGHSGFDFALSKSPNAYFPNMQCLRWRFENENRTIDSIRKISKRMNGKLQYMRRLAGYLLWTQRVLLCCPFWLEFFIPWPDLMCCYYFYCSVLAYQLLIISFSPFPYRFPPILISFTHCWRFSDLQSSLLYQHCYVHPFYVDDDCAVNVYGQIISIIFYFIAYLIWLSNKH